MNNIKNYSSYTQNCIKHITNYIKETNGGKVPKEFGICMDILAFRIDLYEKSQNDLVERGTVLEFNGKSYTNPSYTIMIQSENIILTYLRQFGLTTFSRSKIKSNNEENENIDEFINALTK